MKISVAFIVYNGANYMRTQLDSILAQTRKVDEIVVVEDASLDNTKEILQKLSETYSKKLLIIENKKNMGIGYSMKVGLKKSLDFDNSIIVKIDDHDIKVVLSCGLLK